MENLTDIRRAWTIEKEFIDELLLVRKTLEESQSENKKLRREADNLKVYVMELLGERETFNERCETQTAGVENSEIPEKNQTVQKYGDILNDFLSASQQKRWLTGRITTCEFMQKTSGADWQNLWLRENPSSSQGSVRAKTPHLSWNIWKQTGKHWRR